MSTLPSAPRVEAPSWGLLATEPLRAAMEYVDMRQACLQDGTRHDLENIEVRGSHCGLGWNAEVLGIIAGRLSQPANAWKRDARSVTATQALDLPRSSTHVGAGDWQTPG